MTAIKKTKSMSVDYARFDQLAIEYKHTGDPKTGEKLYLAVSPYILSELRKKGGRYYGYDHDLRTVAWMAIKKAAETYVPDQDGFHSYFLNWAIHGWVRHYGKEYFRSVRSLVTVPAVICRRRAQIDRLRSNGIADEKICEELGINVFQFRESVTAVFEHEISLDGSLSEGGDTLGDTIASLDEKDKKSSETTKKIIKALELVDDVTRQIIVYRFGLDSGNAMEIHDIAQLMQMKKTAVKQTIKRGLERLKVMADGTVNDESPYSLPFLF